MINQETVPALILIPRYSLLTFSFILSAVPPWDMTILERVSNTTPDVSVESGGKKAFSPGLDPHLQTTEEHHLQNKRSLRYLCRYFLKKKKMQVNLNHSIAADWLSAFPKWACVSDNKVTSIF